METSIAARTEFRNATRLHSSGHLNDAISAYKRAADLGFERCQVSELLGLAYFQLDAYSEAVFWLKSAFDENSSSNTISRDLALSLLAVSKYEDAERYFDIALKINATCEVALQGRAYAKLHQCRYEDAIKDFVAALEINPRLYDCLVGLGDANRLIEDLESAIRCYQAATELLTDRVDAFIGLGRCYCAQKKVHLASKPLRTALLINKNDVTACYEYANYLASCGKIRKATLWYRRSLLRSDDSDLCYSIGLKLQGYRRFKESLYAYKKSIELNPHKADVFINSASASRSLRDNDSAIAMLQHAIRLQPDSFIAYKNSGNCFRDIKKIDKAYAAYQRAYDLDSKHEFLLGTLTHAEALGCRWESMADRVRRLSSEIRSGQASSPPFPLFGLLDEPELQRRAAEIYSEKLYSTVSSVPLERYERRGKGKIRLGYFSADLHAHATSFLISELLELHDRKQFEVLAYSFGHGPRDAMFDRIKGAVDEFFDVRDWSDEEICQHAREQKIDIAIDLKGYTQDSRPGIFARRCAPVQINYLGFPGTMGMPSIDYIIADRIVIPECERAHYSEKVLYMPHCYQVNDSQRRISTRNFTRQEFGLPDGAFVFCCFNNNYKILPETFDIWMRLLTRVPGSVLWLYKDNDTAAQNLRLEAARRGVDSSRLVFAERMPLDEHLARHQLADLFLDTFPCNAHTTASDALWAGLPIITRVGRSFSSRVAASLLTAMDLGELISHDATQYEKLAIRLASEPNQLMEIRSKLRAQKTISPLFDTKNYVDAIERLYQQII